MRKLLLLALLGWPLWGQAPTITNIACSARDRAATISWTTSIANSSAARLYYDYDTVSLDRRTRQINALSSNSGYRSFNIYDLNPSDTVYFDPQSSDTAKTTWSSTTCSGTCTNCSSSDQSVFADSSGCNCGGAGEYPNFTTAAEDSDPTPAAPTSSAVTTPPTIDGSTFTVDGTCSDWATQYAAAVSEADTGVNSEIVIPQGVTCSISGSTGIPLTAIDNGGTVTIRTGGDQTILPPAGQQTDPSYLPFLGVLTWSSYPFPSSSYHEFIRPSEAGARGWYFSNVAIGPPALSGLSPTDITITGINTTTNTITASSSISGIVNGQTIFVDLTGTGVRGGQGIMQICNISGATFQLTTGVTGVTSASSGCGTVVDLVGTYGSGGTARRFVALPIAAHTSSNGNHALTITSHGLVNYIDMPVTSGTGQTITVSGTPSEYNISSNHVVHVQGTSGANCDGLWYATVSGSTLTLLRSGQTADCGSVSTGTVHAHRAMSVFRTSSDTIGNALPRAFNVEVVDANTLELLETSAVAGVTGGYLFWDLERTPGIFGGRLISDGTQAGMSEITFDRVIVNSCFPWRGGIGGGFSFEATTDSALINSYVKVCDYRRDNPVGVTGSLADCPGNTCEAIHGDFQANIVAGISQNDGLIIRNNYFAPQPFILDDTDWSGSAQDEVWVSDLQIEQNYLWNPDWSIQGTSSYRNHFMRRSFQIEHKSLGPRSEHIGNFFRGWLSNFNLSEPAIEFSVNGSKTAFCNGPSDALIQYNIFWKGSGAALQMPWDNTSNGAETLRCLTQNITFSNNLGIEGDSPTYNGSGGLGGFVSVTSGVVDFVMDNNTFHPHRMVNARLLDIYERGSGIRMRNNIFTVSAGSNENRMGIFATTSSNFTPSTTEDGGYPAFQEFAIRGTSFDSSTSVISGNIGIPGIKTSSSGTYAVKAASSDSADTYTATSIDSLDKVAGLSADSKFTWVDDTTLDARLALTFESGSYQPTATYTGKGVDLTDLADAVGLCGPVTVTADDDQFDLAFHSATTAEVTVKYTPWDTDLATTLGNTFTSGQTANGATQSKTFTASSLSAGTQYLYSIGGGGCPKRILGLVTTAGSAGI